MIVIFDHAKGSKLVSDACFLSGLIKIETEIDGISQAGGGQISVPLYSMEDLKPDFVVDVTGFMERR